MSRERSRSRTRSDSPGNELVKRLDIIEKKIDTLLDNSAHVRSHINWVDKISSFFLPGFSKMFGLRSIGTRGNLRNHAEAGV